MTEIDINQMFQGRLILAAIMGLYGILALVISAFVLRNVRRSKVDQLNVSWGPLQLGGAGALATCIGLSITFVVASVQAIPDIDLPKLASITEKPTFSAKTFAAKPKADDEDPLELAAKGDSDHEFEAMMGPKRSHAAGKAKGVLEMIEEASKAEAKARKLRENGVFRMKYGKAGEVILEPVADDKKSHK